jgi:hypothetical protein
MLILLLIWLAVGIGLTWLAIQRRRGSAGLPLAYFVGLSLIHVPGALLYLDGEELNFTAVVTRVGFEQTVIGMVAFLVGVIIARYAFVRASGQSATAGRPQDFTRQSITEVNRLALLYLFVGSVSYFVILPVFGGIPSVTAIVASFGSLIVVGACLRFWLASKCRNRLKFWLTMALVPLCPLATLIQGGFLGFGTYWALAIMTFLFAQSKRRFGYLLLAPAGVFVGLSVFVNYMAARDEIRQLVWYQEASIANRLDRVAEVFRHFEWLDLSNLRHRKAIDDRLNQNVLIGLAAERLESGQVEYASGAMLGSMMMALIPRALWPDKPAVGGGGTIVHDFTGMEFAEGTSVGAGQVFEFYVNFGTLGVIGGFLLYGWLVGRMDLLIIEYLSQGDQRRFVFWFLICLALLQPGGNLLEIVVSAASAAIAAYGLSHLLNRRWPAADIRGLPRVKTGRR